MDESVIQPTAGQVNDKVTQDQPEPAVDTATRKASKTKSADSSAIVLSALRLPPLTRTTTKAPSKESPSKSRSKSKNPTKKQLITARRRRVATAGFLIAIGLAGSIFFAFRTIKSPIAAPPVYSPPAPQIAEAAPVTPLVGTLPKSEPVHLRVPDVNIDTNLLTVGRNSDGTLEVPESPHIAGWYKHGPTPGELGPAIIVGHVDSHRGPGVFWRLRELRPGQIIEVKRANGTTAKFTVQSTKEFAQNNFPTKEVYGNINHGGLRLITCGGTYNRITDSYSHNTVVYASLVK